MDFSDLCLSSQINVLKNVEPLCTLFLESKKLQIQDNTALEQMMEDFLMGT